MIELVEPSKRCPRITRGRLGATIALARQRGCAMLLDPLVEQIGGFGAPVPVPVPVAGARPVGAISLVAESQRIWSRLPLLLPALMKAGAELSAPHPQREAAA